MCSVAVVWITFKICFVLGAIWSCIHAVKTTRETNFPIKSGFNITSMGKWELMYKVLEITTIHKNSEILVGMNHDKWIQLSGSVHWKVCRQNGLCIKVVPFHSLDAPGNLCPNIITATSIKMALFPRNFQTELFFCFCRQ